MIPNQMMQGLWFYDQTQEAERFDVETEKHRAIEIFEYKEVRDDNIFIKLSIKLFLC